MMLDEYRKLVARLRQDRAAWDAVTFRAGRDTDGEWIDVNARRRYGALLCLQYDRRRDDHDLIRHLVAEETAARRADPFQGYSETLRIGAALLAWIIHENIHRNGLGADRGLGGLLQPP